MPRPNAPANCCTAIWVTYWLFSACSLMTAEAAETIWCLCRCGGCGAVFHAECRQKAQPCPRCVHRELHHKRPSSFWSADDDSFYLPYQDTWGTHTRAHAEVVKAKTGRYAGLSACFSEGGSEWCRRERLILHQVCVHVFIHQPAGELLQQAVKTELSVHYIYITSLASSSYTHNKLGQHW